MISIRVMLALLLAAALFVAACGPGSAGPGAAPVLVGGAARTMNPNPTAAPVRVYAKPGATAAATPAADGEGRDPLTGNIRPKR